MWIFCSPTVQFIGISLSLNSMLQLTFSPSSSQDCLYNVYVVVLQHLNLLLVKPSVYLFSGISFQSIRIAELGTRDLLEQCCQHFY